MEKHAVVIWLDSDHAKVFKLLPGKQELETIKKHSHMHHSQADVESHKHLDKYFHDVVHFIQPWAKEILILGPGQVKNQFKHYLDSHHKANLATQVAAVEASDHPSDNEILAHARKFFKDYDLFH